MIFRRIFPGHRFHRGFLSAFSICTHANMQGRRFLPLYCRNRSQSAARWRGDTLQLSLCRLQQYRVAVASPVAAPRLAVARGQRRRRRGRRLSTAVRRTGSVLCVAQWTDSRCGTHTDQSRQSQLFRILLLLPFLALQSKLGRTRARARVRRRARRSRAGRLRRRPRRRVARAAADQRRASRARAQHVCVSQRRDALAGPRVRAGQDRV